MTDVKHRLDEIDVLTMPDGWEDIQRRRARTDLPIGIDGPQRSAAAKFGVVLVAFAIFIAAGALLWNGFRTASSVPGSQSATPTMAPLLGSDLAKSLGLELQPGPPSGCEYYVEVDDPSGYCLEGISGNKLDLFVLALELQGRVPSDAEKTCFSLTNKLGTVSKDSPEFQDLVQAIRDTCPPPSPGASP